MEGVHAITTRADPSTDAGVGTQFRTRPGFVPNRKLMDYKLFLLIVTFWECWHLFSPPNLSQHEHIQCLHHDVNGATYRVFSSKCVNPLRSKGDAFQMHTIKNHMDLPTVLYAAADNHLPAGPQLRHRLPMYFTDSLHVRFLLHSWYTDTAWPYIFCCCSTLLLAFISVLLKVLRRKLENLLQQQERSTIPPLAQEHKERHIEIEVVAQTTATQGTAQATTAMARAQAPATAPTKATTAVQTALTTDAAKKGVIPSAAGRVPAALERCEASAEMHYRGDAACRLERVGQGHQGGNPHGRSVECDSNGNAIQPKYSSKERPHSSISFRQSAADVQVLSQCGQNDISSRREDCHKTNKVKCAGSWVVATVHEFPAGANAARAVAAFCNYSVDYVLMLVAMTFNAGIVLSLFAGIALGFLLIGDQLLSPALESQSHSLKDGSHYRHSADDAREGVAKCLPSNGNRTFFRESPITKTSSSTTLDARSQSSAQQNIVAGVKSAIRNTNTSGMPRGPLLAGPEDVYCCTYPGAGGEKGHIEEQSETEDLCCDSGNAECLKEKQRREQGAPVDNYSFPNFECDSTPTTVVLACVPAPSGVCDAAIRDDGTHGVHLSILPPPPSGTEAALSGASSSVQATTETAQEAQLQPYVSYGIELPRSAGSGTDLAIRGGGSEHIHEKQSGDCKSRNHLPAQLAATYGSAEQAPGTLATSTRGKRGQQENTIQRHQHQQWRHQPGGVGAEFQRRPSDCYDVLLVAKDIRSV